MSDTQDTAAGTTGDTGGAVAQGEPSRELRMIVPDPEHAAMLERRSAAARQMRAELRAPPFDPHAAGLVVEALAAGRRITQVGSDAMFPPYWIINQWRNEVPEFDEACVAATQAFADECVMGIVAISDDVEEHPASRAVRIDARLKVAKVLHRKKYGDKATLDVRAGSLDELSNDELARIARRGED